MWGVHLKKPPGAGVGSRTVVQVAVTGWASQVGCWCGLEMDGSRLQTIEKRTTLSG